MLGPYLELMLQFTAAITLPNVVRRKAFDAIVTVVSLLDVVFALLCFALLCVLTSDA